MGSSPDARTRWRGSPRRACVLIGPWLLLALATCADRAVADELPEYRLKAAVLYNFALFTQWPASIGRTLNVCVLRPDPFAKELDALEGKPVGARVLAIRRIQGNGPLSDCQVLFVPAARFAALDGVLATVADQPTLTVADTPGATQRGVALNMSVVRGRVNFEANLRAARQARLALSSKLLRLASDVAQ